MHVHKRSTFSASTSNSKSEGFMSPYGVYDMNDSSFFVHTTRLNIIGPNFNCTQFLRPTSSSPTERVLINCGESSMVTAALFPFTIDRSCSPSPPVPPVPEKVLHLLFLYFLNYGIQVDFELSVWLLTWKLWKGQSYRSIRVLADNLSQAWRGGSLRFFYTITSNWNTHFQMWVIQ